MKPKITRKQLEKALVRFVKTYNIIEFEEFLKGAGIEIMGEPRSNWIGLPAKKGDENER